MTHFAKFVPESLELLSNALPFYSHFVKFFISDPVVTLVCWAVLSMCSRLHNMWRL